MKKLQSTLRKDDLSWKQPYEDQNNISLPVYFSVPEMNRNKCVFCNAVGHNWNRLSQYNLLTIIDIQKNPTFRQPEE